MNMDCNLTNGRNKTKLASPRASAGVLTLRALLPLAPLALVALSACIWLIPSISFLNRMLLFIAALVAAGLLYATVAVARSASRLKRYSFRLRQRAARRAAALQQLSAQLKQAITHQKIAQNTVAEQSKRIQSLATDLNQTEERERRQIAAALHDRVGANLALARMRLEAATSEGTPGLDDSAVREGIQAISTAIEHTRSLTYELSVPILYEAGLEAALGWLGDDLYNRHGLEVVVNGDGGARNADQDVQAAAFQITRELLVNVVKHARAKTVFIGVHKDGSNLRIQIADDGIGFDPLGVKRDGFGLFNVRERLKSLGGRLEIESEKNRGTRAVVVLPIRFARDANAVAHSAR